MATKPKNPCKPFQGCTDDDDYDPCGSNDDITDKDLAHLIPPEVEAGGYHMSGHQKSSKELQEIKAELTEGTQQVLKEAIQTESIEKAVSKILSEEERQAAKKRACKQFIKNPFFTNRLQFSTNLPPPPPEPPRQYLPPVEDGESKHVCPKQKSKPCKNKTAVDDAKKTLQQTTKGTKGQEIPLDKNKGTKKATGKDADKDTDKDADKDADTDADKDSDDADKDADKDADLAKKLKREADKTGKHRGGKTKKKPCQGAQERPICKKRVSEISLSLLPPQLPPLQRDLPPTSPKDTPEVERQIMMAHKSELEKCQNQLKKECIKKK